MHRLVGLDLGALGAALADHGDTLSPLVRAAQEETVATLDALLTAARAAGHVRSDLTAADVVIAVGMITRPQPEAVLRATPGLPERLVDILIAGMRPTPGRVE